MTTQWLKLGVHWTRLTSETLISCMTRLALRSYKNRVSSAATRIFPSGAGKIISTLDRPFLIIGHFFELEPSKLPTEISRLLSRMQRRSFEMKIAARAFSPRFSIVHLGWLKFLSNDITTNWPPSTSKLRRRSWPL